MINEKAAAVLFGKDYVRSRVSRAEETHRLQRIYQTCKRTGSSSILHTANPISTQCIESKCLFISFTEP